MSKVIICLTGCILMTLTGLRAQDNSRPAQDTVGQVAADTSAHALITDTSAHVAIADTSVHTVIADTAMKIKDTTAIPKDTSAPVVSAPVARDTASQSPSAPVVAQNTPPQNNTPTTSDTVTIASRTVADTIGQVKEAPQVKETPKTSADAASLDGGERRSVDTRWFISPLLRLQFQDFGMLEKNRKGYLSDANTLPFAQRGNGSFAASAYKNITGRLSVSADLGLSFGHVTNDNVLISQTKSKTYNLLNASIYYHLLAASYRLQPYVTIGINDLINDVSYLSAPIGIGAKFNAKKVMVTGQLTYGYGVNKNTSNTTMYSLGIYIPLKNKKQKKEEAEDKSPYNRNKKDDQKKDSTAKGGNIINNIYININMDSVLKAKGLLNDDGSPAGGRRKGNNGDGDGDDDGTGSGRSGKHRPSLKSTLNVNEDFGSEDFKVDTIDGVPAIRFVVYFEFNEYGLNTKAFGSIDRVISRLKDKTNMSIVIKGYTDDIGNNQYNNFLSRRRAKMVFDYLNSRGVPSELMQAKAYGSDNPVADNRDPNAAWLNRRAEIIVREK